MCHLSPTVHLAWATLSCALQIFLISHLWRYDRFKCLKWSSGRQPGAFKRVMTYSYCASVPLLLVYSVTMAIFKYRHGYTFVPGHGTVPTPYQLWPDSDRAWLTPLYVVFSVVWGLELVTHLEELTFWLFLLRQGPTRREWFSSVEFRAWAFTSLVAITGMPLTAVFTRSNPLNAEAYIFLAGSAASTCVTTVFFVVLAKFPAFLRRVKKEGAAGPVVLRLVKFHELNIMRVIFRLLFTIPLLILGIDGVQTHHPINESALWSDLLAFIAAVGTVVSSTLTLLIFFPRSLAEDSNWRPRTTETLSHGSFGSGATSHVGPIRPVLNVKPSYRSRTDSAASGNPFSNPWDGASPVTPPSSGQAMVSKTKTKYYSGHFTSPSALTTPYYPPMLSASPDVPTMPSGEWALKDMEEGDAEDDVAKTWRHSDSQTGLTKDADDTGAGEPQRYSLKHDTKDDAQTKVRLMELAQAVDAGLKKPQRPPRLHPYIMSFTSPIDLLHTEDETAPRAI